jgi:hypothetical protein
MSGAEFWLRVMDQLRNRDVEAIMPAALDGQKGFPDGARRPDRTSPATHAPAHYLMQWNIVDMA